MNRKEESTLFSVLYVGASLLGINTKGISVARNVANIARNVSESKPPRKNGLRSVKKR